MKYFKCIYILLPAVLIISCGTDSTPEKRVGIWQSEGLGNEYINAMDYSNSIFFVVGNEQMFKKSISESNNQWINIELEINNEYSEFGDVLITEEALFAVLGGTIDYHDLPDSYISLYKSPDEGESWEAVEVLVEESEKPFVISRIAFVPKRTFYSDAGHIYKSDDGGQRWNNLTKNTKVGASEFFYVSKEHPNQIWTGGWTNIGSPSLTRSTDGGESWSLLNKNIAPDYLEASVYDVIISPKNEKLVLAGVGGAILKSNDGGNTWKTVFTGIGGHVFQNSLISDNRVYASGMSQDGRLFVAISNNYGNSWEVETFDESPDGIWTNDMIVAEVDGNETIYFGTNKGVYSYTFKE